MAVSILGEAAVRLRPDSTGFEADAEAGIIGPLGGVAKKAAGLFAAAFAAEKVGEFLKDSVLQASDLSESTSKVGVVFGDASQQVLDFASNSASAFGQSRGQALEAAGTFGNLLRSIGLSANASADMSTKFVGLASDLASFNNTDPAQALEALRSGLTGETEPLKQYGINLNDAALKQEALRLGLDASGPTLSAASKAQAAYSLIMQQSTLAQGDFTRTSAGLANQQRIMASQFVDLKANIGGLFVPVLGIASGAITGGLLPALLHLTNDLPALGTAIGSFGDYARAGFNGDDAIGLAQASGRVTESLQLASLTAGNMAAIFGEAFADGKAGADLLAQDGLGGLAARAGTAAFYVRDSFASAFQQVRDDASPALKSLDFAFASTWGSVKTNSLSALSGIRDALGGAFAGDAGPLAGIAGMLGGAFQAAVPAVSGVLTSLAGSVQSFLPTIVSTVQAFAPVVVGIVQQLIPVVQSLLPVILQVAGIWREVFLGAFQALLPVLPTIVSALGTVVTTLISGLAPVLTQLGPIISQVASAFSGALIAAIQALVPIIPVIVTALGQIAGTLAGAFTQALQAVLPVLPVIADVLGQVAGMLAGALASALQAVIPILPPLIDAFAQIAVILVGVLMQALQAILPIIPTLVQALLALIQAAVLPLLPLLPVLASLFMSIISALAPLIPPLLQLVAVIIQLVVAAIVPLLPIIPTLVGLLTLLLNILLPIIQVVIGVVGAFVQMASVVLTVVLGFVSAVIGAFTSFFSGITSLVSRIAGGVIGGFTGLKNGVVGVFSGIADTVGGFFEGIGGAVRSAINAVIRGINGTVIGGLNLVIDGVNVVNPFDNIPHVPRIPTFHTGGEFYDPSGEGLALLRSRELVVTPEQRATADDLLRALVGGDLSVTTTTSDSAPSGGVSVVNHITQLPGESGVALAAKVSDRVVFNLNNGVTPVGGGVTP